MIAGIKKNKKWKNLFFILLIIFVLAIAGFLVISNSRLGKARSQLIEKIESLKKEIQKAGEKNQELKQQVSESSQESFIEKEARERLNLQKPGEKVVVVLPPKEEKQEIQEQKNLWQRILDMLKSW